MTSNEAWVIAYGKFRDSLEWVVTPEIEVLKKLVAESALGSKPPAGEQLFFRLARHEKVAMRIAELVNARQEEDRLQAHIRGYKVINHLEETMVSGQSETVRLRAAELLGKTVGLFAEQPPAKNDTRSLAELEDELRKRLKGLKVVE